MNVTTAKAVSANGAAFAQLPDAEEPAAALVSRPLISAYDDALATAELPMTPPVAMVVTGLLVPGLRTCSGVVSDQSDVRLADRPLSNDLSRGEQGHLTQERHRVGAPP
jgi:hypothetical protein